MKSNIKLDQHAGDIFVKYDFSKKKISCNKDYYVSRYGNDYDESYKEDNTFIIKLQVMMKKFYIFTI